MAEWERQVNRRTASKKTRQADARRAVRQKEADGLAVNREILDAFEQTIHELVERGVPPDMGVKRFGRSNLRIWSFGTSPARGSYGGPSTSSWTNFITEDVRLGAGMGQDGWLDKKTYQRSHAVAVLLRMRGNQHDQNMADQSFRLTFGGRGLRQVLSELRIRFELDEQKQIHPY